MGFPISSPPGGAAYVYTVLSDVLNGSWQLGIEKSEAFDAKIASASGSWLDPDTSPRHITASTVSPTAVSEPSVTLPAGIDHSTVLATFDSTAIALASQLADGCASFISTYFPDDSAVFAAAESWLADELVNPDRVLPETLANTIWEEDRSRILSDATRAADDAVAFWAARRFPLPPGRATAAVTQIEQTAQNELAKSSRNVAIKTFEMAYDKVKFAITSALDARKTALGTALDYIKTRVASQGSAGQVVEASYEMQMKLIAAVAAFYNARTDAAKLAYASAEYNAKAEQFAQERNQAADLSMSSERVRALLSEAGAVAQMATALFNNLHAQASAQGSDSVSSTV